MFKQWYQLIYNSTSTQYVHIMENRFTNMKKIKLFKEFYDRCSNTKNFKTFIYFNSMLGGNRTMNNKIILDEQLVSNGKQDYKKVRSRIHKKFLINNNPRTLVHKTVIRNLTFDEDIVCLKRKLKRTLFRFSWAVYNNNIEEDSEIIKVNLRYAKKYPGRSMTSEKIGNQNNTRDFIKAFTGKRGYGDFTLSEVSLQGPGNTFMFMFE